MFVKRVFLAVLLAGVSAFALGQPSPNELGKPEELIVAKDLPASRQEALITTARGFYVFWNSGDAETLAAVVSPHFTDHTLPPGRPQGPGGPLYAIQHFKEAVPDLHCEVTQQIIAGDRVVSHLRFTGHFSGSLGTRHGSGQVVDFIATDILRIDDRNQIADNWHIEDNLTFLQQIGAVNL
jgi:predicted ester cyclase